MTRLYIAGPMSGIKNLNFPAFHTEAARLRALGFEVVNPAEINNDDPNATFATHDEYLDHWRKCMRADITELMKCDGVVMLDGWTASKGATLEHHIAYHLGLSLFSAGNPIKYLGDICRGQ